MKKKVLAALLCAAMAGTMLAGCGGSGDGEGGGDSAGSRDMGVEGEDVTELTV